MDNSGRSRLALLLVPVCLWGCGSQPQTLGHSGPALSAGDFVDAGAQVVEGAAPTLPVTPANTIGPFSASGGILDVTASPGRPNASPSDASGVMPSVTVNNAAPAPAGSLSLVDLKVGDINGRPVFANAFLDSMADQLRAETVRMKYPEWRAFAKNKIDEKLSRDIRDELLRAEAMANFTPEQKQGFFAFMQGVQQRLESQNLGSRSAADARLESTEGMSLDQYMKRREQEELIGYQLREKIDRRVSVPWRDIRQEYDRYFDVFNPPPKARYRLVQIPASKADDIKAFESARASGTAFESLASNAALNRYKPDTGGVEEREIKGDRSAAKLFGNEALNAAAQTVNAGEVAGPIKVGDNMAWLQLESIVEKKRTLYDSQMDIESVLRRRRVTDATDRYIAHLRERASISSSSEMSSQLLAVADGRFWTGARK
jgi:hypothetical protein